MQPAKKTAYAIIQINFPGRTKTQYEASITAVHPAGPACRKRQDLPRGWPAAGGLDGRGSPRLQGDWVRSATASSWPEMSRASKAGSRRHRRRRPLLSQPSVVAAVLQSGFVSKRFYSTARRLSPSPLATPLIARSGASYTAPNRSRAPGRIACKCMIFSQTGQRGSARLMAKAPQCSIGRARTLRKGRATPSWRLWRSGSGG